MKRNNIQKTFTCTQVNDGSIDQIFPLLCPVREKDWIDGWNYLMIHSESGLIEKDCVFSTPHHGDLDTIWQVTQYDPVNYVIEFIRFTPNENVVRINIHLEPIDDHMTKTFISYKYTVISEERNRLMENKMEESFNRAMKVWESSINHYLKFGEKLLLN